MSNILIDKTTPTEMKKNEYAVDMNTFSKPIATSDVTIFVALFWSRALF